MSFWDDLKKSLGGAADYTVKKTGEVTGTAKLRMDIRLCNTRLAKAFETVGRAYYKQSKGIGEAEANEETIRTALAEADSIKAEIAALRRQLAELQGCVLCPSCSAQISDKSLFCPLCGQKLAPKEAAEDTESAESETPEENGTTEQAE